MWVNRSFRSNHTSNVSEALISLTKNEQPWASRSGCSEEMSDVSESLILITKKERTSELLIILSELLIRSFMDKKPAIRSEIKWMSYKIILTVCKLQVSILVNINKRRH